MACRLMLDILPGLETSAVFQPDMEGLIHRLFSWAEKSSEPLQSYATGLLAAAMEVQDIATGFREQNGKMVPLMLKRLHQLQEQAAEERKANCNTHPFAHLGHNRSNSSFSDNEQNDITKKRKVREKNKINGVSINTVAESNYEEENQETDDDVEPLLKKLKNNY